MHRGTKLECQTESNNMFISSYSLPYNWIITVYEKIPTIITLLFLRPAPSVLLKVDYNKVLLIFFVILNMPKDWLTVNTHVTLQHTGNTMLLLEIMYQKCFIDKTLK